MNPTDFLKSKYYLDLNEKMNAGEWPQGCEKCQLAELAGLKSSRTRELNKSEKRLHVFISNVCNSDCIMCDPMHSSSILSRLKKHPDPTNDYQISGEKIVRLWDNEESVKHLIEAMDDYDVINIVGGEPTLDKKLWEFLSNHARSNLKLSFVTNGNTSFTQLHLDLFSRFKEVRIGFSIDATDTLYEWIRDGLSWSKLLRTILSIKRLDNVLLFTNTVVQAHNILNLPRLDLALNKYKISSCYDMLFYPSILSGRNAPKWALEKALSETINEDLKQILSLLLNSSPMHSFEELVRYTDYLNSHRSIKFDVKTWDVQKDS